MLLEVVLLLGLRILLVAAHRPHQLSSLSLLEGRENLKQNFHKEEADFTVTIRSNGTNGYGFLLDLGTGGIRMVFPGSPADIAGLKRGQHIIAVGTKPYAFGTIANRCFKTTSCQITVAKPKFPSAVASAFRFLNVTAGFVGVLIVLSLPWIVCQSGTCEVDAFGRPAVLFMVGVSLISSFGEMGIELLDWPYANLVAKIGTVARCTGSVGLAGGCLANRRNPLLNVPLYKEQSQALRHASWLALALFSSITASTVFLEFWKWNGAGGILNTIYGFRYLPQDILTFIFTSLMAQISIAACQGMADIAETLSHGNVDFVEQVHKPCGSLLDEVPPKLAPCGLPLLLVCFTCMIDIMPSIHEYLAEMWSSDMDRTCEVCEVVRLVSWVAAASCPLAVSLGQLSSGLKRLEAELNEQRMRDPSQHLQVQEVEEMLAEAGRDLDGEVWEEKKA